MPPPPSDSYEPSGLPSPPLARDLDPRASAQLGVHHHPHYASIPHPFDKTLEEGEKSSRGTSHLQSLASLADSSHSYITSNTPLYSTNKGVIDDALKTLSSAGSGGSSGKNGLVDDWLNPVNKVIKGLEGLVKAQPFPFLSLGVSLFSGVVKLEVERRTNNIKARALVLQMADMMSALLQLHYVRDPTAVSSTGDSIQSRFHTLMRYIESDIKSCGALINKHHQHSKFTKWLRAGDYSELYTSAAGNLANRKGEIKFACTIHVTVGVEEVRRNVHDTNTLLRRVIAIIEHKSDDEREFDKVVNQHGGTERIRDNPDVALQVHARFEKLREAAHASRQNPSSKSLPVSKAPTSRHSSATKGEPSFDRKELLELQQPLEKIVKDSLPFFEGKLIAQVEILRDEIDKSTQQILARLEAGAHDKIVHPDVQYVWKDMGWRSSVGAKVFVLALHDYYVDRYALAAARSAHDPNLTLVHSTPVGSPNAELPQHSPLPSANLEIVPTTPAIQQDFTTSDAIILADKPFFDYLTMPFVNAIIQAFDDDASGFVRISEVNEFCESIPEGWTLLQWIAYWARGWLVETSYYAHAIGSLLQSMEEGLAESLAENHNVIYNYLTHQSWIGVVRSVAWCAASKSATKTDTPLDDLIAISMAKKEERLEKNLARFQFLLDTPEALKLICDSGRIEKDIFALLFILLRRHVRLVSLAKERVIDEREFLDAQNTLVQIAQTITQRVEEMQSALLYSRK
ncbi:hypothetical protein DL93DRAFT_617209 [Clavulina sp. PMI_390]|nr:hypothetical protein DL93DRAFT_617209 [Clavulina sp. PMI_390]